MSEVIIRTLNLDNLIPNSQRTHEELSEMGRKGGKASGVTRRAKAEQRKRFKVYAQILQEAYSEATTKPEQSEENI